MARMPGVEYVSVGDGNSKTPMKRWDVVCVHTIVGYFPAPAAHFSTRHDGHIRQHRDTAFQSAANYNGNGRVIAIENEDHGPAFGSWNINDGHQVPAFTSAQCEAIARICVWANQVHGIPLVLCPDSRPGSRGIAYHRQGIDSPNNFAGYAYQGRVSGGEVWTTARGKVCPGDRRISQLINTIIPRARALAGGAPLEEEDEMAGWLQEGSGVPNGAGGEHNMKDLEVGNNKALWEIVRLLGDTVGKLDALTTKVDELKTGGA